MSDDRVERRAKEIWRERELQFPAFVRRIKPDDIDRASGAWELCLQKARGSLQNEKGTSAS